MNRGFTLLEVVIAILILSFATLTVIAMQTSVLQGYVSIRNNDEAVQIAHRTSDLLQIASLQWRANPSGAPLNFASDPYDVAPNAPFDIGNPIQTMNANRWQWVALFDNPVDARMANYDSGLIVFGGRHCVYVRGGPFEGGFLAVDDGMGNITDSGAMHVQIAVLSTGPGDVIRDCNNLPINPTTSVAIALDDLDINDGVNRLGENLEIAGLRPTYFATNIYRRGQ